MNSFLIAVQFISRIPVKKELDYNDKALAKSMIYYPLIGILFGGILVLIDYLASIYFGQLVTSSLLLMAMVLLTGGIHLDGLMDSCDGLLSGRKKDRILEIMRDSRVGAFGVIGLVTLFLLKFSLLVELPSNHKIAILLFFPTISRWAIVYAAFNYPYARKSGLGKVYAENLKFRDLLIVNIWTLLLGVVLFQFRGLIIFLLVRLMTIIIAKSITKKIDGLTGDNYGAINEIVEVFAILIITLVLRLKL
ncbi:cobalamin-5'-phosphate synthase [Orenia metallireducens]|uniref:Adenosylcobinamide-GDP ribazoletransferase n=1 Tax=Orenia metallireducens TaxID=1413210 RepID=A0A285GPE5_9FIRM|nr:adenosylcobinamide-GDP ribazoletransferase [Orenia metallireducens]PRX29859.1 cobalamin-5'-phosphate synthase [Orenia metallireducens]SNY25355.1 cobalamin-5'-phosphate synthase [Orenia metallireducens]